MVQKGSEISAREWLEQIGATKIRFVGNGGGPPDFLIEYVGETIAVEVTRLLHYEGWERDEEIAFERELQTLIEAVWMEGDSTPRWHVRCEYDPREPCPPKEMWIEHAREALRTAGPEGGEYQLLAPETIRGRGVNLELLPASNEGSFSGVSTDKGLEVVGTLIERIIDCVSAKAGKIANGKRSKNYSRWWLVLDDEVLIAPVGVLTADERAKIEERIQGCDDRERWSKIVLMSRFQTTPPPPIREKWFYAPWEDPRHPPLPASP